jgi:1,4-alpha-glucan branching enzyme
MNKYPVILFFLAAGAVVASVLIFACCHSKKELKSAVIHPDWSKNAVIYEVNIRQYTPEGTFAAFEKHIPRLKEMGVDILWLMPINPIGIKNRKGTLGSYYSVKDYLGVNPELGTKDDLKSLVKSAHNLGMKVIIDWVANHTSWDNDLIAAHPDWYKHNSAGNIISPVKDWTDVAGLNYNRQGLREYMKNALIYWVKEADIDGYRCDVASMLPVDFWNQSIPEIKKIKHVFMLAESDNTELHDTAFDMTYNWDVYHLMNQIAKGEKTANYLDTLLVKNCSRYPADAYRMLFTSNHDENSWGGTEYERLGDAVKCFAALTFTLPGMPLIYSGQEAAFNHRLRFFDKDTINWDNYPLAAFYSTLIKMKKENEALWNGTSGGKLNRVKTSLKKEVYAFLREKNDNRVLAIFNLTAKPVSFSLDDDRLSGNWSDVFTKESFGINEETRLNLDAWGYRILESR